MHFLIVKNAPPPSHPWEVVLPTQAVLNSNLVTPENFIEFCPSFQKLFMVFFNTEGQTNSGTDKQLDRQTVGQTNSGTDKQSDRQTVGQTDRQTPYKTNHPTTLYGYRRKFFILHFFQPLSKWSELAMLARSLRFVRMNKVRLKLVVHLTCIFLVRRKIS